jgi:hypothetical protein
MRTRLLLLAAALLASVAFAPSGVSASTVHAFHSTKDCSRYTGANPSYCTITVSNVTALPRGSKVWYSGPVLSSSSFVASVMTLKAGTGNTATGYCIDDNRTGLGTCAFWKGTGTLVGFHAIVTVTADAAGLYHWDGKYWFNGR